MYLFRCLIYAFFSFMKYGLFVLFLSIATYQALFSQTCEIKGVVKNEFGQRIQYVSVSGKNIQSTQGVISNDKGEFTLKIKNEKAKLSFSHISYKRKEAWVSCADSVIEIVLLSNLITFQEISVQGEKSEGVNMDKIDPKNFKSLPSASGSFESILFSQAGVSSRNELSSQYSVRGGNFDENLIYVNDIEIFRPISVRAGQQEGLSFINSDMVGDVFFSAGGFESKYGDKLSSVLDVKYKQVDSFFVKAEASFLGASLSFGDVSKDYRFQHMHGVRLRSNQYLLGALETQGDYQPVFADYQTLITYDITSEWSVSVLGNISINKYNFTPENRRTDFGTVQQALRLNVFFEGQEKNSFDTYTGAVTLKFQPNFKTVYKWINSTYGSNELELFDVLGYYRLSELEADLSKEEFGDEKFNLGVGGYLSHARNELYSRVYGSQFLGKHFFENSNIQWGIKYQTEKIRDRTREWLFIDSSDYSLPHFPDSVGYSNSILQPDKFVQLQEFYNYQHEIFSHRFQSFFQYNFTIKKDSSLYDFSLGNRLSYWTYNNQWLVSPRFTLKFTPNTTTRKTNYRAALGIYHQPPFYREMRSYTGTLNNEIKAQSSAQLLLGVDYFFEVWDRPFKFTAETYYKYLWNLIPYDIDNVRIRYYAENNSVGYTYGLDLKLNGELVKGIDSWFSLSLLNAKENISDDSYYVFYNDNGIKITPSVADQNVVDSILVEPGYIRRLTDQRVNVGLFLQDYFPNHPEYKVHLNLLYGSRIPYGTLQFRTIDTLLLSPYRRVDIGFSAMLKSPQKKYKSAILNYTNSIWATLEVFNLFEMNNTISYLWVRDIYNRQWPVPNYLTSRRINLRIAVEF